MASHVVVIDSTARRATVKVTPGKYLSDVLDEACKKLGLNASQYGLKYVSATGMLLTCFGVLTHVLYRNNNKQVDLSRTIRLSGLSSGAKLELVQSSRSPTVISVAIQLPESEAQGIPNGRLTDKFPSTTTLWHVLRKFEAGVAGGGGAGGRNLTAKSVPVTSSGSTGAGGLFYQQPVVNVMGRELSSFTDLQKTLSQLGFNSGSALLRLNFKTSDTPMHEAMAQIEQYFKSEGDESATSIPTVPVPETTSLAGTIEEGSAQSAKLEGGERSAELVDTPMVDAPPTISTSISETSSSSATDPSIVLGRPIQIFAPPSTSRPHAASIPPPHNETDYIPTVEHAQAHQRSLQAASRNTRLLTDAELEAQAAASKEKLASITSVDVKVRFPDQTSIISSFTQQDTGKSLYDFVRDCLDSDHATEPFLLKFPGRTGQTAIPDSSTSPSTKLIQGLQLKGRVMVTFSWDPEKASQEARRSKTVLKEELREKAKEIEVPDVNKIEGMGADEKEDQGVKVDISKEEKRKDGEGGGKKIPKWLKLPGKK